MSFFDKALSSIGIGAAKVDTRLDNNSVVAGGEVTGSIYITGGNVAQNIDKIYLKLMTYYMRETENNSKVRHDVEIARVDISQPFMLNPKESKAIPFAFMLPYETPVSLQRNSVWISTGLDVKMAIDPSDKDYINVMPHPYMACVLDALTQDLGFNLAKIETEYSKHLGRRLPFVQEFEFRVSGEFRQYLDELEAIFYVGPNGLEVILEIDRKARGFKSFLMECMEMDESLIRISFSASDIEQRGRGYVAEILYNRIRGSI